ncbi:OsmC family protein [Proteobacteria bacterium 005FR1]|nr:OsmC family protein [Proteobacteria bacterium 005FR1]
MSEPSFKVDIRLIENYLFEIDFGDFGNFMTDEPEPLGKGEGPNPARLLAASVANCLCASLLFALRKFKEDPGQVTASVSGNLGRVDRRWRIERMNVAIQLGADAEDLSHLERALEQFEDFCVVTQSVRNGIPVAVTVSDKSGALVKSS